MGLTNFVQKDFSLKTVSMMLATPNLATSICIPAAILVSSQPARGRYPVPQRRKWKKPYTEKEGKKRRYYYMKNAECLLRKGKLASHNSLIMPMCVGMMCEIARSHETHC